MIKKINQILIGFLFQFYCTMNVSAQGQTKFPLRVGDKMPEIVFHTMVNYAGEKAKLSDFAGKPVILDLWHVHCTACIAGMPKMQELQKKFDGKIQIIGFGMNNIADYKKLKKRSSILKSITDLPLALQADTSLFKNLTGVYPTHIWIDGNGIIRAITSTINTTEKYIQDFIDGKELTFIMNKPKHESSSYYPQDTSILSQGNGMNIKKLQYHSLFSGRVDFNNSDATFISDDFILGPKNPGIRKINKTAITLVINALDNRVLNNKSIWDYKLVIESKDLEETFLVPNNDEEYDQWLQNNTYCYELSLPQGRIYSEDVMREYFRQDIQRFFGVRIEAKPYLTNCLILYRLDNKDRIKTNGMFKDKDYEDGLNKGFDFKNIPLSRVVEMIERGLSWRQEPVKVIDETLYKFNVDMTFDHKLNDVNLIRASLKRYGLGLKEEQRVVDCIVISRSK